MMLRSVVGLILLVVLGVAVAIPPALAQPSAAQSKPRAKQDQQQRERSLKQITDRLGIGRGATIADIGAGAERDSWTFAGIVGESGKVCAVEIEKSKVDALTREADKRNLPQVVPVLGRTDDSASSITPRSTGT